MEIQGENQDIDTSQNSEQLTDTLERVENELQIIGNQNTISDDVRLAHFQIESAIRDDDDNEVLQSQYANILEKHNALGQASFESHKEYIHYSKELLQDLRTLRTVEGDLLIETEIDAGFFDMGEAVIDGVVEAGEKIWEDLKQTFAFLNPDELSAMYDSIVNSELFEDPIEFFQQLLAALRETGADFANDIQRDWNLISENSTTTGGLTQQIKMIVSVGIPAIFQFLDPTKFLKVFKILKIAMPQNIIEKTNMQAQMTTPEGIQIPGENISGGSSIDVNSLPEARIHDIESPEIIQNTQQVQQQVDKVLARNQGLTETEIRRISGLSDTQREIELRKTFPELSDVQINNIIFAHNNMSGKLFEHSGADTMAKARLLMKETGLDRQTTQKIMDMGFAGKSDIELSKLKPQDLGEKFSKAITGGIYDKYGLDIDFVNKKLAEAFISGDKKAVAQLAKSIDDPHGLSGYDAVEEILGNFDLKDINGNKLEFSASDLKEMMKIPRVPVNNTDSFLRDLDSIDDDFFSNNDVSLSNLSLNGGDISGELVELGDESGFLSVKLVKVEGQWKSHMDYMSVVGINISEYFSNVSPDPKQALKQTLIQAKDWGLDVNRAIDS